MTLYERRKNFKSIFRNFVFFTSLAVFSEPGFSWVEADGKISGLISWEDDAFITFDVNGLRCAVPAKNSIHLSQITLAYSLKSEVKVVCHDAIESPAGKEPFRYLHKIFVW